MAFSIHSSILLIQFVLVGCENVWSPNQNYDFIVVGAGAAGAAVAARLMENGKYQVLLLEAGGEPPYFVEIPYLAMGPFEGKYDWSFVTEKQEFSCFGFYDNKWFVPRGKALGGSTLLNGMVFTRGNRNDYDHWKSLGNDGWGYEDVLPFFKRLEDYQGPMKPEEESYHSKDGPVTLSVSEYSTPLRETIFDGLKELGYTYQDYNGEKQTGYFHNVATVRNGSRCDAYTAYLKPNRNKPNLHIVTNAFVSKVKIDSTNRATGVYFEKDNIIYFAAAKKEVILSAGSNNSPHLLMLSGIGPKDMLQQYKISIVAETPGVGENLQDHSAVSGIIFVANQLIGPNFMADVNQNTLEMWHSERKGPLSLPIRSEVIGFLNSKYADQSKDWPDFELQFVSQPFSTPNLKKENADIFLAHHPSKTLVALPILMRPKSVGHVRLQSADPHTPLKFQPNYLKDEDDLNVLLEAIKTAFRLIKTEPFVKLDMKWHGAVVPGCEMHKELSDEYLKCFIRHYTYGLFHQSGTCKMGPKSDHLAVVDSKLRVHGISGLRVADVSICPTVITGHTMAPAFMIGEKAAAMILEEWENHHDEL